MAVRKGDGELYAENLFQAAKNPRDLTFSRFLLLQEDPPKPHFAPSVKEAVSWFQGRNLPKDGYGHIWWGDKFVFKCATCQARRELPLRVTAVEHMTVATAIPHPLSIEGWRVIEVETELTGKGNPDQKNGRAYHRSVHHLAPGAQSISVRKCAENLAAVGRRSEAAGYLVFDTK